MFGRAGAFSFFSNKNMATGEGGMVVTGDDEVAAHVRRLRSHGMTTLTWDRHRGHAADYDVTDMGYNYRLDEVRAAIGLEQLRKIDAATDRRREAARPRLHGTHRLRRLARRIGKSARSQVNVTSRVLRSSCVGGCTY